jgi:hypothetical protein
MGLLAGMSIAAVGLLGGTLACGGFRSGGEAYEVPKRSGSVVVVILANLGDPTMGGGRGPMSWRVGVSDAGYLSGSLEQVG